VNEKAFVGASVVAAIVASLCCILPIVFVLVGAGIAGAAAFFATWRPLLLVITFLLLALGFYFAYRKRRQVYESGTACERPAVVRIGRIWLWIATALVVLFAAFPYYSGAVAKLLLSAH
jgi:mercuric ion transport protein